MERGGEPRLADREDEPLLRGIVEAAYTKYLPRMDRPPAPMFRDLTPGIEAGLVWVTGEPVVGLICLTPTDQALLIENVAVHPDAQGRGVGRLLMSFAERQARLLGVSRLQLYTNEVMTENLAIYTHLGYREVDRRTENGYHRVFMEKTL